MPIGLEFGEFWRQQAKIFCCKAICGVWMTVMVKDDCEMLWQKMKVHETYAMACSKITRRQSRRIYLETLSEVITILSATPQETGRWDSDLIVAFSQDWN